MDKRLNIGLFVDDVNNHFASEACKGAELAARAIDANLYIFPGHYIGRTDFRYGSAEYDHQNNTVFNLATENNIDVLYILLGSICSRADEELQKAFMDSLPNVPVITLFMKQEGFHSFTFDNKSGMGQAISHLIHKHDCKKIGFVSGPKTNTDALERLEVFTTVLEEEGIAYTDSQIVFGDFTEGSDEVVKQLIAQNDKLDAIVFANDSMAIGGYRALKELGLEPGKDIRVCGFDDDAFAAGLTPPLTTVEASSAELVYKAVLNANSFIDAKEGIQFTVDTHMVQRSSCGCEGLDFEYMFKRLGLDGANKASSEYSAGIKMYLFGAYAEDETITKIKKSIDVFTYALVDSVRSDFDDENVKKVTSAFADAVKLPILEYTTTEKLYNVLQTLAYFVSSKLTTDKSRAKLAEAFSECYRKMSFAGIGLLHSDEARIERIAHIGNVQSGLIMMDVVSTVPYSILLEGLDKVGINESYLYVFQGDNSNTRDGNWKMPGTMLLKALNDGNGIRMLPEEQELVRTESIFDNEHVDTSARKTMIVNPLFVGEAIYGMIVNVIDMSTLAVVTPVAYQTSITLRILHMIEHEGTVRKNLEESLEQFMRDNRTLAVQSKIDDLTGLYNRRGFLENAKKIITSAENAGKKAIMCYADMDNLKMVNDVFGHDEGDFSLRECAGILNDAFRHTDIIGRFGGDEFVACAIVGKSMSEEVIKKRIEDITKRHNKDSGKEYPIEMSVGLEEFICGSEEDVYAILERADEKLYAEKKARKEKNGSYR